MFISEILFFFAPRMVREFHSECARGNDGREKICYPANKVKTYYLKERKK